MGETENKQLIRRAFDAWAAGTGSVFDLLAPDARWTIVGSSAVAGTYHSREQFLEAVIRPFNARLETPLVPEVHALYADGDTVIAYFDASGKVRDGSTYRNTYTWYLRIDGGAIVEATAFYDSIAFNDLWMRVQPGG
jgi:uncharacterized protein